MRLEGEPPILRLVLDHPGASNALSGAMMHQLQEHLTTLERLCADPGWGGTGLILRGEGIRAFCAGSDLRLVREHVEDRVAAEAMCALMQGLTERLWRLPLVSVAAIEGAAVGGGAELITACDLRVMASNAKIRFVQARMGLSCGWGGGARLVRLVGRQQALRLLGSAAPVTAEQALEIGLVDAIAPPGGAEQRAEQCLAAYSQHPATAQRAAKAAVAASSGIPDEVYRAERAIFLGLWGGPAHRMAMARL